MSARKAWVYAEDVQQEMLNAISRRVRREGLSNVRPVLGRGADPRLPEGSLDVVLIVDAYHEIEDRVAMLTNAARSLKPQGRIGVIDFKVEGGGPGPEADERVDPELVVADASRAGLRVAANETFLPYQYLADLREIGLGAWGLGLGAWGLGLGAWRVNRRRAVSATSDIRRLLQFLRSGNEPPAGGRPNP